MRLASIVVGRDMRIWRDTGMPPGEEFVDWMVLDDGKTIVVLGAELNPKPGPNTQVLAAEAHRGWGRPAVQVDPGGKGTLQMVFSRARNHDPLTGSREVVGSKRVESAVDARLPAALAGVEGDA
jgi:hypothetical protein